MKVAQFGALVALHSAYHHGEQNLYDTIVRMAQNFPGSNNVSLFYPDGQFGSRLQNGQDFANPRYIFTKLDLLTRFLFHSDDDELLTYRDDDGSTVEPYYYVPILPVILINGSSGIGTAWSSKIPNYNPIDLVRAVKRWLNKQELLEIDPWYMGWTGKIEKGDKNGKYNTYGIVTEKVVRNKTQYIVSYF